MATSVVATLHWEIPVLSTAEIHQIAKRVLADYDAHRPNDIFAERGAGWLTLEDAYAVQHAVAKLRQARGEHCVGYKVGCVSPAIQRQLGLHEPVRGYLWASERHQSGTCLEPARYVLLAIEGELALQLRGAPCSRAREEELFDCIERCFPVLELHQAVFRGNVPTRQELVAGNAMHAGFVVPPGEAPTNPVTAVRHTFDQLRCGEIRVELDGQTVETRSVEELPGGPLGSLRWLVTSVEHDRETLPPDALVLTGSPGQLIPVRPGTKVTVYGAGQKVEILIRPTAPQPNPTTL